MSGDFGKFVDETKKTKIMIISSVWGKKPRTEIWTKIVREFGGGGDRSGPVLLSSGQLLPVT